MIPFRKLTDEEVSELKLSKQNTRLIVSLNVTLPNEDQIFSIWMGINTHRLRNVIQPITFDKLCGYLGKHEVLSLRSSGVSQNSKNFSTVGIDYYDAANRTFATVRPFLHLANVLTASNFPVPYAVSSAFALTGQSYFGPVIVPRLLAKRGNVYNGALIADVTASVLGVTGKLAIIEPSMDALKETVEKRLIAVADCEFVAKVGEAAITVNSLRTFGRESHNNISNKELDKLLEMAAPFDRDFFNVWTSVPKPEDNPLKEIGEAILKSCEKQPDVTLRPKHPLDEIILPPQ